MELLELKSEIIARKNKKGWTNQQLADASGVPIGTVCGVTSPSNGRTPSYETAMRLMDALTKDDILEQEETETEEMDPMQYEHNPNNLTQIEISHSLIDLYEKTIADKERWVKVLAISLAVVVLFVFTILVYDITHPTIGWVQH